MVVAIITTYISVSDSLARERFPARQGGTIVAQRVSDATSTVDLKVNPHLRYNDATSTVDLKVNPHLRYNKDPHVPSLAGLTSFLCR